MLQHGAWVTGGVLVAVLIGLGHSLWSSHPLGLIVTGSAVLFSFGRSARLLAGHMAAILALGYRQCRRPASAGAASGRGAVQRCSLEPPVLAVPFLDGNVAHRPVAELNGAAALDWSFRAGQAHSHQQQRRRAGWRLLLLALASDAREREGFAMLLHAKPTLKAADATREGSGRSRWNNSHPSHRCRGRRG